QRIEVMRFSVNKIIATRGSLRADFMRIFYIHDFQPESLEYLFVDSARFFKNKAADQSPIGIFVNPPGEFRIIVVAILSLREKVICRSIRKQNQKEKFYNLLHNPCYSSQI